MFQVGTIPLECCANAFQIGTCSLQTGAIALATAMIHFQTETMRVEIGTIQNGRTLAVYAMRSAFETPRFNTFWRGLGGRSRPSNSGVWGAAPQGSDSHRTGTNPADFKPERFLSFPSERYANGTLRERNASLFLNAVGYTRYYPESSSFLEKL
ncbi:MAG: hypothetical protein KME42_19075 [Tildeniella nuda ZEHNDER 1965/U140]|nr:hypothetical protein [Tildeniella nuda ZEHNDER 1965/U140]